LIRRHSGNLEQRVVVGDGKRHTKIFSVLPL
jgi:hypothetical protein